MLVSHAYLYERGDDLVASVVFALMIVSFMAFLTCVVFALAFRFRHKQERIRRARLDMHAPTVGGAWRLYNGYRIGASITGIGALVFLLLYFVVA